MPSMENEIILGDCLEVVCNIPDNSIDFICIDPPYGMTAPQWDKQVDFSRLWIEFKRIRKPNSAIAIFTSQPFTTKIISSNPNEFRYCWYWMKNQATNFFHAKRMPTRKVEEICIFGSSKTIYYPQISEGHVPTNSAKGCSNGKAYHGSNKRDYKGGSTSRFPTNVLNFKCVDNYSRLHSSQKPLDLMEYLVKTYTKENEIVLDCFSGTGTTLLASKNLSRKYIGIEKDENSFNISIERMKGAI